MNNAWRRVTKTTPCPICKKDHACKVSSDGAVAMCKRIKQGSFKESKGWYFHRLIEPPKLANSGNGPVRHRIATTKPQVQSQKREWQREAERLRSAMTDERLEQLAEATGIPATAWAMLSPGWVTADDLRAIRASGDGWKENPPDGAWAFTEYDADGRVVGLSLRAVDERKGFPAGAHRGLVVPRDLAQRSDPVLIVEGASDVAACCALGLAAVGRPSNMGGADDLSAMLDGRNVLVVGEHDAKEGGRWPGRDGAKAIAQRLAGGWGEPVRWTLPPMGVKDVREWLKAKLVAGLNPTNADAMRAAGVELLAELEKSARTAKAEKRTQADALVNLAQELYRFGTSTDGEAFAVRRDGVNIALMFRGGGGALRSALAKNYRQRTGKTPSASALADALLTLEGMAGDIEPEPVALRVAHHNGAIVLDLGDALGRAVVVTANG